MKRPLLTRLQRPWVVYALIGLITSLIYLLLPTLQYSGDGMRWYATISGAAPPQLGGTNHLLYPPLARLYFSLAHDVLGVPASFALAQSMNAWFGGAGIACLTYVLFSLTRKWGLALGGAVALAFSATYSAHAVDMTEPMPGVFLSMLALACVMSFLTHAESRRWLVIAAGVSIGLAASIYQSNVLTTLGAGAFLMLCDLGQPFRTRLVNLVLCVAIAGAVALATYLITFIASGNATTLIEALAKSLRTENEATRGIYAELSLRRVGVLIFGLGGALLGLRGVTSQSTFLARGLTFDVVWTMGVTGWAVATIALISLPYATRQLRLSRPGLRAVMAILVGLAPQLFLLIYWGARYSKLWMMPLAYILMALVILVSESLDQARLAARLVQWPWIGLVVPVMINGLLISLPIAHLTPNPGMQDTLDVAARVSSRDLIISDWGGTPYAVPSQPHALSLTAAAFETNLDATRIQAQIKQEMEAATQRGGTVYFYDLLDLVEMEWRDSYEQRLKLPYTFLDDYKKRATPVMLLRLQTPLGNPMYLWRVEP